MPQHILIYTDDPGIGGVAQYNHAIALGLIAAGYRVTLVQTKADNPLLQAQAQAGVQHEWLEYNTVTEFARTYTNFTDAQVVFARTKPDLIFFSDSCPVSNMAARQVAIAQNIPYVIGIHFVAPYLAENFSSSLGGLAQQFSTARAVLSVCQQNLEMLRECFRLPADRGDVIYSGCNDVYFEPPNAEVRDRLRQSLGIPDSAIVCLTTARLEEVKGFQHQMQAITILKQTPLWEHLYFLWLGEGGLRPYLERSIQQLEVGDRVKLLGHQWEVANWLDAADLFILPSHAEGMPLVIMEAMAKGVPVIATAVSGIPEELGDTGKLLPDPGVDAQATVRELLTTLHDWMVHPAQRQAVGEAGRQRAQQLFRQSRMVEQTLQWLVRSLTAGSNPIAAVPVAALPMTAPVAVVANPAVVPDAKAIAFPPGDYVSPGFATVQPDAAFPNMAIGDPETCPWQHLRREIPHNWYVDRRQTVVGFLSRDEAHILYNTALKFQGQRALEIGCWMGWSACHLALAGVVLDVVDPLLARPEFYQSVSESLQVAGVLDRVTLIPGYSPQKVEEFAAAQQRRWSLIFIDGNHEAPGPLQDAILCEHLAEPDAIVLFHDLASPDVAQGLDYFRQCGWNTMVYQTMQIMGVAWRGQVEPVQHQPDPTITWTLPEHLRDYAISGVMPSAGVEAQVQALMQQAIALYHQDKPAEALQTAEAAVSLGVQVPGMQYVRSVLLCQVGRHDEGLAAAEAELAFNPTHEQAQAKVAELRQALAKPVPDAVSNGDRSWHTALPTETLQSIHQGVHQYSYRGVPLLKNPFDFALYPLLVWNLKPRTIIEIGSKDGGSALWLGDLLNNYGIDGQVYSVDIVRAKQAHPRVTFLQGNGRSLADTFTPAFIEKLPRPLLVIEDADHAFETTRQVLEFFHPYLHKDEWIVVEDGIISDFSRDRQSLSGPHQALQAFLAAHPNEYAIASEYCDFFGYNLTWNTNGYLKKLVDPPQPAPPPPVEPVDAVFTDLLESVQQLQPLPAVISIQDEAARIALAEGLYQGHESYLRGNERSAVQAFQQVVAVNPGSAIAHAYLSLLHWRNGEMQQSLQHFAWAEAAPFALGKATLREFQELLEMVRPYTLLSESRLFTLYSLAKQVCLDDVPGHFVECGTCKGGSAAMLAAVIQRYSLRPRLLYACDTFEGMPTPTEVDRHEGIPANDTGFGEGTLAAPIQQNLLEICTALGLSEIVVPVKGLFSETLPQLRTEMEAIAFLHADGDWYESTMDIFHYLYGLVMPGGIVQVDDYGFWEGCRQAIHELERQWNVSFPLHRIDTTGVWFRKETPGDREVTHWQPLWIAAQRAKQQGKLDLARQLTQAILQIAPRLLQAEDFGVQLNSAPAGAENWVQAYRLRPYNLIAFPNWQQPEEKVFQDLLTVLKAAIAHPKRSQITLLIDMGPLSEEEADLALSGVTLQLFTDESLEVAEDGPEIVLLKAFADPNWQALVPYLTARLLLPHENPNALALADLSRIPTLPLNFNELSA